MFRQSFGDGAADPSRRAGDDRDPLGQVERSGQDFLPMRSEPQRCIVRRADARGDRPVIRALFVAATVTVDEGKGGTETRWDPCLKPCRCMTNSLELFRSVSGFAHERLLLSSFSGPEGINSKLKNLLYPSAL